MNHTDKQSPRDYIAARYEGYKNQVIRIKLYMDEELTDYHFALCDVNGKLIEAQNNYNDGIHLSFINDAKPSDGIYALVIVYMEKGLKKSSYLRNLDLLVPEAAMGEAYDKRQLYRQRIRMEDDCSALLCYQPDQTLALEVCSDESKLYTNRIMNEVLMEIPYEDEKNGNL